MANDKYYGYSPKREKPSKTQGQVYSGAEKSTRKGQVTHGTYANIGNRLDRVNPYEFRKGMDYELVQMGVSRLAESTPEEREKATEAVLKNLDEEDEDVTAKKATRGAKRASKKAARFDQEIAAIEEFLFGKNKKNPEATADEPAKGSLIALKDQHLDAYKANKDVEKYKKAIQLPDSIIKKLEKHVEKFGEGDKGKGNKVKLEDVKGKDLPETIKKLEARISAIKKEEEEALLEKNKEKSEIASTDMTRANHLRLLEIIRENGISLREGKDSIKVYYEIAKQAYLEGLSKGLKL